MYPKHLELLFNHARDQEADYVWSWFDCIGGKDPFPQHFGRQFDINDPHQTTITTLVRTELAQSIGFLGTPQEQEIGGHRFGEDFQFTLGCANAGGKFSHLPIRTWAWTHHGRNTSGAPGRGDAK
jgi:hypothetical protein